MSKLKEKVSDLEVKVSELQEKLGNSDNKPKINENETIDDEIKRLQECQRINVDKIEDIDRKINNLMEQQEKVKENLSGSAHHGTLEGFQCNLCEMKFTISEGLQNHVKYKHP